MSKAQVVSSPLKRAPFRAWVVTGPVGRLAGFMIEFAVAMWALLRERRAR